MKRYIMSFSKFLCMVFCLPLLFCHCEKDRFLGDENSIDGICGSVTDRDGNTYKTVKLGDQIWMAENLRTTHYADGSSILKNGISTSVGYMYDHYLYNWRAVMGNASASASNPSGVQGICPDGWHVPSASEWKELEYYVGSKSDYCCGNNSAYIAKALASDEGWTQSYSSYFVGYNQFSENNATHFYAYPFGYMKNDGYYYNYGKCAIFWSATLNGSNVITRELNYDDKILGQSSSPKNYGLSVRCVKD